MPRFGWILAALALIATAGLVAGASWADQGKRGIDAIIKIKLKDGTPKFKGPDTIHQTGELQVLNTTSPSAIGPHTFSLVKKAQLPDSESERIKCARLKLDVCEDIAAEHEMTRHPIVVGEHVVESGVVGWDASFDGDLTGDSWFTDVQDEDTERTVPNTGKLFYLCIVHPRMQGSIKVIPQP